MAVLLLVLPRTSPVAHHVDDDVRVRSAIRVERRGRPVVALLQVLLKAVHVFGRVSAVVALELKYVRVRLEVRLEHRLAHTLVVAVRARERLGARVVQQVVFVMVFQVGSELAVRTLQQLFGFDVRADVFPVLHLFRALEPTVFALVLFRFLFLVVVIVVAVVVIVTTGAGPGTGRFRDFQVKIFAPGQIAIAGRWRAGRTPAFRVVLQVISTRLQVIGRGVMIEVMMVMVFKRPCKVVLRMANDWLVFVFQKHFPAKRQNNKTF